MLKLDDFMPSGSNSWVCTSFSQVLHLSMPDRDLVQCQLLMSFPDTRNTQHRVIVEVALTATPNQLPNLVGDFQQFVTTVQLDRPA